MSVPREKLWRHLQKIKTPQYLRDIIQTMYTGCLYVLIDGNKFSEKVAPSRGLKQGCPLSPLLYSLNNNDIDRFLTVQRGGGLLPLPWAQFKSLTVIMLMTLRPVPVEEEVFYVGSAHTLGSGSGQPLFYNACNAKLLNSSHIHTQTLLNLC